MLSFQRAKNHPYRRVLLIGISSLLNCMLMASSVHAQNLLNRLANTNAVLLANDNDSELISDVVDDRAIKQLISKKAEFLLPNPEESLLGDFEE